jgi:hypothetical protein
MDNGIVAHPFDFNFLMRAPGASVVGLDRGASGSRVSQPCYAPPRTKTALDARRSFDRGAPIFSQRNLHAWRFDRAQHYHWEVGMPEKKSRGRRVQAGTPNNGELVELHELLDLHAAVGDWESIIAALANMERRNQPPFRETRNRDFGLVSIAPSAFEDHVS